MKTLLLVASVLLIGLPAGAAPPDCSYSFHYSNRSGDSGSAQSVFAIPPAGSVSSISINNIGQACVGWEMLTSVEGLTALSIQLETSTNTYSMQGPQPLKWEAFKGTTLIGTNPSTSTTVSTYAATGYYPWLRVNLASSSGTGSIDVQLFGWRSPSLLSSAGGSGTPGAGGGTLSSVRKINQIGSITLSPLCDSACSTPGMYGIYLSLFQMGAPCPAASPGGVNFHLTWTDTIGTVHSSVIIPVLTQTNATNVNLQKALFFSSLLANAGGGGSFYVSTNGAPIQYSTTFTPCTTGNGNYALDAAVTRLL